MLKFYYESVGAIAHLGERIHGMDEVAGSSPVCSTIFSEVFVKS